MREMDQAGEQGWSAVSELETPFAEVSYEAAQAPNGAIGFAPWSETPSPFAEAATGSTDESTLDEMFAEAFAELRDEAFDEAVAYLAEETEQTISERFSDESPTSATERERYADAQLSIVRFEAEQYIDALESGLTGADLESLTDEQFDAVLDRMDPEGGELTPAGEEFIGGLVRKAKKVVKFVAKTAKSVGKVAGAVLGPILKRLKKLINPLLRRVLSFAIGRLPAPLQPVARTLAKRFTSEAGEEEQQDELPMSPANLVDVEMLAEQFDLAMAEAMIADPTSEMEEELFESSGGSEAGLESRELERLAEARGLLIDQFRNAGDEEDLSPAVEQFVPALLGALRLGISLVGRPKVVGFLAKYLGQLIRKWVGPKLSGALSNAIVDVGLRLITLEAENDEAEALHTYETGPIALASVVEDTVRRLAESEEYIFENDELMQLATAEAFSQAVATHFPPRFVRPALQQAPSLGGTFVTRKPRSVRPYRKYSRTPEIDVTAQVADALPSFGGGTVGSEMRASGATFPVRARMHIYQSAPGTTLPRMIRLDRATGGGRGYISTSNVHPLTPPAAGMLLREPQLGVQVPASYLRSRNRIAVGQRFYVLEPLGASGTVALPAGAIGRAAAGRLSPSRAWISVNRRRARITVGIYLSEVDAQRVVEAIRQGRGGTALLQALVAIYRAMERSSAGGQPQGRMAREEGEEFEEFAARAGRMLPAAFKSLLRRRIAAWVLPALANWSKGNGEAFARAAAHPDAGVTVRVRLAAVPGLDLTGQAASGALKAMRGSPPIAIAVTAGRRRL